MVCRGLTPNGTATSKAPVFRYATASAADEQLDAQQHALAERFYKAIVTLQAWARGRATRVAFQQIIANLVRLQRSYGFRRHASACARRLSTGARALDLSISVATYLGRRRGGPTDETLDLSRAVSARRRDPAVGESGMPTSGGLEPTITRMVLWSSSHAAMRASKARE